MYYDLSKKESIREAEDWLQKQIENQSYIKMRVRSPKRSLSQNAYLHVLFGIFALDTGIDIEEVKQNIFKRVVNNRTFVYLDNEGYARARSTADLSKEEMTFCIEKFRHFSSMELGIYLPSPNEHDELMKAEILIEKNEQWL